MNENDVLHFTAEEKLPELLQRQLASRYLKRGGLDHHTWTKPKEKFVDLSPPSDYSKGHGWPYHAQIEIEGDKRHPKHSTVFGKEGLLSQLSRRVLDKTLQERQKM